MRALGVTTRSNTIENSRAILGKLPQTAAARELDITAGDLTLPRSSGRGEGRSFSLIVST